MKLRPLQELWATFLPDWCTGSRLINFSKFQRNIWCSQFVVYRCSIIGTLDWIRLIYFHRKIDFTLLKNNFDLSFLKHRNWLFRNNFLQYFYIILCSIFWNKFDCMEGFFWLIDLLSHLHWPLKPTIEDDTQNIDWVLWSKILLH